MVDESFPAHKVIGNVYYVGSKDLASYLITTPEGHILINSGFEETVPLIGAAIESLGFKVRDIKILLDSHAHSDHVAGHARVKQLTGAKVYVMRGDDEVIASGGEGQYLYTDSRWTPCKVDRVLEDGDEGHARRHDAGGAADTGPHPRLHDVDMAQSPTAARTIDVVVIGSPNVNPGYRLVDNDDYPEIADDFAHTFERSRSSPATSSSAPTATTTAWSRSTRGPDPAAPRIRSSTPRDTSLMSLQRENGVPCHSGRSGGSWPGQVRGRDAMVTMSGR